MYNYYKATFTFATANTVQKMGIPVTRENGYYVLVHPPVQSEGRRPGLERIECWCRTKKVAEHELASRLRAQKRGYWLCPCGANKQAVACCGIPKIES